MSPGALLTAVAVTGSASAPTEGVRRHALVVGADRPARPSQAPLRYADAPPDRDRATTLAPVTSLFEYTAGDPNAEDYDPRRDRLDVDEEIFRTENLSRNFGGVFDSPAEGEGTVPRFAEETAWEAAFDPDDEDGPVFASDALEEAFAS